MTCPADNNLRVTRVRQTARAARPIKRSRNRSQGHLFLGDRRSFDPRERTWRDMDDTEDVLFMGFRVHPRLIPGGPAFHGTTALAFSLGDLFPLIHEYHRIPSLRALRTESDRSERPGLHENRFVPFVR